MKGVYLPPARLFLEVWERSGSLTEVSCRLRRRGYVDVDPQLVLLIAQRLRRLGVGLKVIPQGELLEEGIPPWCLLVLHHVRHPHPN